MGEWIVIARHNAQLPNTQLPNAQLLNTQLLNILNDPVWVSEMGKTSPYPLGRVRHSGWD
ncbi:MAG: hypothetical protein HLUCCO16_18440 [Phormidium sp. OSCR]|nr:MAG: hypothetical protein HLUCCO16_18440 [Phormidium sp. OSCR]